MPIDPCHFIELGRHSGKEALQDPHRQRHREQAVCKRHRDRRIEQQSDRGIQLEKRQKEYRGRCHAIGQEPEEQLPVAEEAVAGEGVGGRYRDGEGDQRIDDDVGQ